MGDSSWVHTFDTKKSTMRARPVVWRELNNRCPRRFFPVGDVERKTQECLRLLEQRTNVDMLLRCAGGNSWIVKRAIALYNLSVSAEWHQEWALLSFASIRRIEKDRAEAN